MKEFEKLLPNNLPIGGYVIVSFYEDSNRELNRGVLTGFDIELRQGGEGRIRGVVEFDTYRYNSNRPSQIRETKVTLDRLTPIESMDINQGNRIENLKSFFK